MAQPYKVCVENVARCSTMLFSAFHVLSNCQNALFLRFHKSCVYDKNETKTCFFYTYCGQLIVPIVHNNRFIKVQEKRFSLVVFLKHGKCYFSTYCNFFQHNKPKHINTQNRNVDVINF